MIQQKPSSNLFCGVTVSSSGTYTDVHMSEGSEEQEKMKETGYEVFRGAQTNIAVKG